MTKQRTFSGLLVIVLALLGLDLALRLSPREAVAQDLESRLLSEPPVQAVSITIDFSHQQIYRLWRDGTVEWNRIDTFPMCGQISDTAWCGWVTVPETAAP